MEYSYYVAFRTLYNTALCCITAWDSSVLWKRDCLFLCLHIYQVLFFCCLFFFSDFAHGQYLLSVSSPKCTRWWQYLPAWNGLVILVICLSCYKKHTGCLHLLKLFPRYLIFEWPTFRNWVWDGCAPVYNLNHLTLQNCTENPIRK